MIIYYLAYSWQLTSPPFILIDERLLEFARHTSIFPLMLQSEIWVKLHAMYSRSYLFAMFVASSDKRTPLINATPIACVDYLVPPQGCMALCHMNNAAGALMIQGDICVCILENHEEHFLVGRNHGVCDAPCNSDTTLTCGGGTAYDIFQLFYDGGFIADMSQSSLDGVVTQAGLVATADDDDAGSVGAATPAPGKATAATKVAADTETSIVRTSIPAFINDDAGTPPSPEPAVITATRYETKAVLQVKVTGIVFG